MISSLLMTGTVAPCAALPDAQGPLSFPLSSSHTQPPLLSPPSVQSNDCPLHAPYHLFFLSCCYLLWILKHGVRNAVLAFTSHECRVSVPQGCTLVNQSPNQHVIVVNSYTKYWEVQWRQDLEEYTLFLWAIGRANKSAISPVPEPPWRSEVR